MFRLSSRWVFLFPFQSGTVVVTISRIICYHSSFCFLLWFDVLGCLVNLKRSCWNLENMWFGFLLCFQMLAVSASWPMPLIFCFQNRWIEFVVAVLSSFFFMLFQNLTLFLANYVWRQPLIYYCGCYSTFIICSFKMLDFFLLWIFMCVCVCLHLCIIYNIYIY